MSKSIFIDQTLDPALRPRAARAARSPKVVASPPRGPKPLPDEEAYRPYVTPLDFAKGLTYRALQRTVAGRRAGDNFATIALCTLNLPVALVERAYNRLPANLR